MTFEQWLLLSLFALGSTACFLLYGISDTLLKIRADTLLRIKASLAQGVVEDSPPPPPECAVEENAQETNPGDIDALHNAVRNWLAGHDHLTDAEIDTRGLPWHISKGDAHLILTARKFFDIQRKTA